MKKSNIKKLSAYRLDAPKQKVGLFVIGTKRAYCHSELDWTSMKITFVAKTTTKLFFTLRASI
ncbi:hypothetical protein, partial [Staphylococcus aureus]|uniref:hypothetical protein n=1 Tax=Staphylococcus aureus TaxID=1280 RepID=UPI0019625565